ncbi:MAG: hypothetical protein NVSMB12_02730 [Acidimicrobiales bacterium]
MATRVLLIRHAQSEWNAAGRWQGWADPPLSPTGAAAAEAAATDPVLDAVDAAASSDLHRARATAELLAAGRGWSPPSIVRGLRERGAGEWTGLTRDEIELRWPGALRHTPAAIPGGETVEAVTARAVVALHRLADHHPGVAVVAVSHGALIRAVAHHLGVAPAPVSNLGGLWIDVGAGRLRAGPAAEPLGLDLSERAG